jgi:type IV pilus assembly protein PilQ
MEKGDQNNLILKLYDVDIPEHRCRPLVTTYFRSAVERIVPVQRSQGQAASTLSVKMREQVPYHVSQTGEGLFLTFEPSTLEPPTFALARKKLVSGGKVMPFQDEMTAAAEAPLESETDKAPGFLEKKVYTGEKIRLDFFETDIKNVFRILRSVSGKNFAVDKDVTGSVTMTLDKPVPWDQVLDLVLKMNRLGQIQEGTIVRIATQATLAQEQKQNQDALTAHKASLEQRKSLEPLVTEYIPINYSSAEVDVKPHLEKILTPDRGILSVDSRTNMIILTDVREKIDQAKELIHRLDKVTPQIMISARVVEVNKNFSKSLGINWGASSADVYRDDLGGSYGFNVAMNYPVASQGSLGFDFSRISGTPLELNATLSASEIKGDVKIISSPKILTLDNKKAKIKQGLEYAYLERDDSGGSSVKFKSIDLLLEVTPHVTPDQRIAMSVLITKNDLASVVDGVPSLSTNEAETELLVNDGNTIVIGGIVKNTSSASENGFPGISNIPLLGRLFGSDSTEDSKNELLIFITPTIVQLEQRAN